jgi:hypothetical protein
MVDIKQITQEYIKVIKTFKNRSDVLNGVAIGYHDNQDPNGNLKDINRPHSIGQGFTTTGFCVSVSQAFNNDPAFKLLLNARSAFSKLISIDIKEQFYGRCFNGNKNTYHTAILVCDSDQYFVIDLTCAQFGNKYVDKFIWDFRTWERTFRSPMCTHTIQDQFGAPLSTYKTTDAINNTSIKFTDETNESTLKTKEAAIRNGLNKVPTYTDTDIEMLVAFFLSDIKTLNAELYHGCITKYSFDKVNYINKLLMDMPMRVYDKTFYHVEKFMNKNDAMIYIKKLMVNDFRSIAYLTCFDSMAKSVDDICAAMSNINAKKTSDNDIHYIVMEFISPIIAIDLENLGTPDRILIPFGMEFEVKQENIFNGSKLLNYKSDFTPEKTNTIYIRI